MIKITRLLEIHSVIRRSVKEPIQALSVARCNTATRINNLIYPLIGNMNILGLGLAEISIEEEEVLPIAFHQDGLENEESVSL